MEVLNLIVFFFVYAGMLLGEIPGLLLDRTGIALLGAIVLLATGCMTPRQTWEAVDVSTIALLFGLMVVSAQFRLGGFYGFITKRIAGARVSPPALLALLVCAAGVLSALLANDIVCLAVAPVLIEGCALRKLNPVPFLLGLACSSNVGSAATLIGNPQNMLIGEVLHLSFSGYLVYAVVPSVLGLAVVWAVIARCYRGNWRKDFSIGKIEVPRFSGWHTAKGGILICVLVFLFLFTSLPRDVLAVTAAGILLMSRRMASRDILGLVDWQLLVLFFGLFVVNHSVESVGLMGKWVADARAFGVDPSHPGWLFAVTAVLSNLVSNVPATMLLLPFATHPLGGPVLALASTLAGNLLIVGSIANIIVIDQAKRLDVELGWKEHARTGVPVTILTLLIAAGWLWFAARCFTVSG